MSNTFGVYWLVTLSGALGLIVVGGMFLYVLLRRPPNRTAATRVIAGLAITLFNYFFSFFNGLIFNSFESVSVEMVFGLTSLLRAVIGLVGLGLIVSGAYAAGNPTLAEADTEGFGRSATPFQSGTWQGQNPG